MLSLAGQTGQNNKFVKILTVMTTMKFLQKAYILKCFYEVLNMRYQIFRFKIVLVIFLAIMCCSISAFAHAVGENYIFINIQKDSIDGRFEIHSQDLKNKLGINLKGDKLAKLEVINAKASQVHNYIREHFSMGGGGKDFNFKFTKQDILGPFAQYFFHSETGPLPDILELNHNMLFEDDAFHRGLLLVEYNQKTDTHFRAEQPAMIFSNKSTIQQLDLNDIPKILGPKDMIWQGVLHIWIGIDHILFILAIIIITLVFRKDGKWIPVANFKRAFLNVLSIFTVFTIAHSITLGLAALELINVPSRLVESIIALSIVLVALNNVVGKVKQHGSLLVILVLGLFHGLGFASVMGHLPFRMVELLKCVIGFNIGVELGQIAIVSVIFPILFLMRRNRMYVPVVIVGVSIVLIFIAATWFIQRSFDL